MKWLITSLTTLSFIIFLYHFGMSVVSHISPDDNNTKKNLIIDFILTIMFGSAIIFLITYMMRGS